MSTRTRVHLLSLLTVFLWGSAFPLTKIALESFASHQLSFLRCLVAALALLAAGFLKGARRPKAKDLPLFCLCGGVGFAGYLVFFSQGLVTLPSATSSLVVAVSPILTAVGASFLWKETIRPRGWVCIACAFGGVALLLLGGSTLSVNAGICWTLGAAFVFCVYNLTSRLLCARGYTALEALIGSVWVGVVFLLPFAPAGLARLPGASGASLFALVFLGLFPSAVSYLCWNLALSLAEKTSDVTNYMFVTPLFSTLLGFALLWEVPSPITLAGGAVIIASILLFNKTK